MYIRDIRQKNSFNFLLLVAMINLAIMCANIAMVYKVFAADIHVFGFNIPFKVSLGTLIFPATYFFSDIIAEVYGYQVSRQLIWVTIVCEFVFTILVSQLIRIPAPHFWNHQQDYNFVFSNLWRVAVAHLIALPFGMMVNAYVITKWKVLIRGRYFWLRSICSTSIGELIFTSIAVIVVMGTGAHLSSDNIIDIIGSTYVYKVFFAVITVIPAVIIVKVLKRAEGIDIYDTNTNFNPLRFKIDRNSPTLSSQAIG